MCILLRQKPQTTWKFSEQHSIGNWLRGNKVTFNIKYRIQYYSTLKRIQDRSVKKNRIYTGNDELQDQERAKCLAVHFDKRLSWDKYIQYTNSKINRCPGILKKIKNYVQVKALQKTYLTLL